MHLFIKPKNRRYDYKPVFSDNLSKSEEDKLKKLLAARWKPAFKQKKNYRFYFYFALLILLILLVFLI